MNAVSASLFQKLVQKNLLPEVHHVLDVGRQGFDVRVSADSSHVSAVFEALLLQTVHGELHTLHLVHTSEELTGLRRRDLDSCTYTPVVLIGSPESAEGAGLVDHSLPPIVDLLPQCGTAVRIVLDHHGLSLFNSVFSPDRLVSLKPLLARGNLTAFIDAVVQTAYLEGARGESDRAAEYLQKVARRTNSNQKESLEVESVEKLLQWIVARERSPHQYIKALLSYFVVHGKGLSNSQASQALRISRTTLQGHLELAEKLGVADIFGHARSRVRHGSDHAQMPV